MESKEKPKAERKAATEEFADDTEVLFPMGNLSLVSSQDQVEISFSSRVQKCRSAWKKTVSVTLQDEKLFNLNEGMTLLEKSVLWSYT